MTPTHDTTSREIRYSREDRDYSAYLNGQYVGSFRTYHDAEIALDRLALDQLQHA
jgi:hypothetical protein